MVGATKASDAEKQQEDTKFMPIAQKTLNKTGQKTSVLKNKKILMDFNQASNLRTNSLEDLSWNRNNAKADPQRTETKPHPSKIQNKIKVSNRAGVSSMFKKEGEEMIHLIRRPSSAVSHLKPAHP